MVASNSARDVGADFAAGRAHSFGRRSILKKRLSAGKVRVKKVIGLAKVNRSARRLFVASVFTQKTFAHQISGLFMSEVLNLRRQAANYSGIFQAGRCLTVSLAVAYGPRGDPHARILKELFALYFKTVDWWLSNRSCDDLRSAWMCIKKCVLANNGIHRDKVSGILGNVICTLAEIKWQPIAYNIL